MLIAGMARKFFLLMLTVLVPNGSSQPQISTCDALKTQLEAFRVKYCSGGAKATLKNIEQELGKAHLEPGIATGTTHAVFALDGCSGEIFLDSSGVAWMTRFGGAPPATTPQLGALEQLQSVDKRIKDLRTQMEGLEALKSAVVKQTSELPPIRPQAARQSATAASENADSLYASDHFEEAAQAYTALLRTTPSDGETLVRRAYCYHRLGRVKDAIQDYTDSIRIAPTATAYNNRALAYIATGQTDEALADIDRSKAAAQTASTPSTLTPSTSYGSTSNGGPVSVKGYTRKDGTYVAPHTRSAPTRRK
jgi:tetratricopeptide (TPR) repeat protein